MSDFLFTDDFEALRGKDTLLLMVPAGLADKAALLAWYAETLRFPSFFGENWDALIDCLRDLSWIGEKTIQIVHRDMPLANNPADQSIYLDILAEAVRAWKEDAAREFQIVFPARMQMSMIGRQ